MRLKRCKIDGFGKITNLENSFSDGLNCFFQKNEWGKSTFAAFLRIMFYGFDGERKRRTDELCNERTKFKPWNTSSYGGWLEFSILENGVEKEYRLERKFGEREKYDFFRLISLPDRREITDFTGNIGESLFGVDSSTFERSIFCADSHIGISDGDMTAITAKLTELQKTENDVTALQKAQKSLLDFRRSFSATGERGKIPELMRSIQKMKVKLSELDESRKRLHQVSEEIEKIEQKLAQNQREQKEIEKRKESFSRQKTLLEHKQVYDKLVQEWEEAEKNQNEKSEILKNHIPSVQDLQNLQEMEVQLQTYSQQYQLIASDSQNNLQFLENSENQIPDESEIREIKEREKNLLLLKFQSKELEGELEEKEEYDCLSASFSKKCPLLSELDFWIQSIQKKNQLSGKSHLLLPFLGGFFMLLGVTVSFFKRSFGIVFLLIGVGLLLFSLLKKYRKQSGVDRQAALYLAQFGRSKNEDLLQAFFQLKRDTERFSALSEKIRLRNRQKESIQLAIQEKEKELSDFSKKWNIPEDGSDPSDFLADRLKNRQKAHDQLEQDKKRLAWLHGEIQKICQERSQKMSVWFDENIPSDACTILQKRTADYQEAKKNFESMKGRVQSFSLELPTIGEVEDLEDENLLSQQATLLQKEWEKISQLLSELQIEKIKLLHETENQLSCEEEKTFLEEELEKAKASLYAVDKARELLEQANRNLSERYLDQMKTHFSEYLSDLDEQVNLNCFHLNSDLNILVEEGGSDRKVLSFSKGKQSVLNLCARFALSDALFEKENPFWILDDPFCDLDDDWVQSMLQLLKKISEKRQILYFTCSQSRVPEGMEPVQVNRME
jgi:hypothetical protein